MEGMGVVYEIERVGSQRGKILKKVMIADCGTVHDVSEQSSLFDHSTGGLI